MSSRPLPHPQKSVCRILDTDVYNIYILIVAFGGSHRIHGHALLGRLLRSLFCRRPRPPLPPAHQICLKAFMWVCCEPGTNYSNSDFSIAILPSFYLKFYQSIRPSVGSTSDAPRWHQARLYLQLPLRSCLKHYLAHTEYVGQMRNGRQLGVLLNEQDGCTQLVDFLTFSTMVSMITGETGTAHPIRVWGQT